ncbi:MAG: ribonuclease III [Candidatus Eisenbacteria bacterium]|nr:ribonuclease III [Candidatus Eisenbacteria bacterium]
MPGQASRKSKSRSTSVLLEFEKLLGFKFKNKSLLKQALTHRSYAYNKDGTMFSSNERMEFLGDSILGFLVSEHLYSEYPHEREGTLTKMKSLLVSKPILVRSARKLKLGKYLFLGETEESAGGRERSSILADAFEALFAAIYLEMGLPAARRFAARHLLTDSGKIMQDLEHANFKSMLQEYVQDEFKTPPRYRVRSEQGPEHEKQFVVDVSIDGEVLGEGGGMSKKEAEQRAARDALEKLRRLTS